MVEENRRRDDVLLKRLMDCTSQHHDAREPVDKSPDGGTTSSFLVVPRSGSEAPESTFTGGSHLPKAIPPPPLTPEISLLQASSATPTKAELQHKLSTESGRKKTEVVKHFSVKTMHARAVRVLSLARELASRPDKR